MATKKPDPNIGQYVRSVLLHRNEAGRLASVQQVLGRTIDSKIALAGGAGTVAEVPVSAVLRDIVTGVKGIAIPSSLSQDRYTINPDGTATFLLYACGFSEQLPEGQLTTGLALVSPITDLLPTFYAKIPRAFYRFLVDRICCAQYQGRAPAEARLTRLNAKLYGEKKDRVTSICLFGEDVVSSVSLERIIERKGAGRLSTTLDPFDEKSFAAGLVRRYVEPTSCKIRWREENGDTFSMNVDKFGNMSFRLHGHGDFALFLKVLRYFHSAGALELCESDPINRINRDEPGTV